MINTIPVKIPKRIMRDKKEDKYDNIILFVLAVYGPHKLQEFLNDHKNSIVDRLEKKVFDRWTKALKTNDFVEDYKFEGEMWYKITPKGEDELLSRLENLPSLNRYLRRLIITFEGFLGPISRDLEIQSKSITGYKLRYKDFIFGILSISIDWRLNSLFTAANIAKTMIPNEKLSVGTYFDYNAETYPNRPAVLYEDIKYTHRELNEMMNRIGIKRGDTINVFLENRPELMFIIGAMTKIGSNASLINTRQRSVSLVHSLKVNKVKAYVIGEELYPAFKNVISKLELSKDDKLYFLEDKGELELPEGFIDLKKEVKTESTTTPSTIGEVIGFDPYAYIFTSGTTGFPKASPMRNIHMAGSINAWGRMAMDMYPDDVMYITLPLFHSNAMHIGWSSAICGGSAVALARKFSVRNFWKDVRKYNVTCFNYIGELCRYLLNQPPNPNDRNHNVYKICGNGLKPEIWNEFKERFGIREVIEHYGATEIRGMFCNYLNLDRTIGFNFEPYAIVKYDIDADKPVENEKGFFQNVDDGEAGLLLIKIRNETTFAGYKNKEATERKIFRNSFGNNEIWLNTGDMIRNIGFYHCQFVDRLGDTFRW
ncbi:MAG: AMP-binding protein, partial [Promethearchaeota archaeon]